MFAPKDEKAKFRVGSKVTYDTYPGSVFKIIKKLWEVNGSLRYVIMNAEGALATVRQKSLDKA